MSARAFHRFSVALGATILATRVVGAKPRTTRADELFEDAQRMLAEGYTHEACTLFRESYRLDPAPGAALNLAVCHEREGKIASAVREFEASARLSEEARQKERATYARGKIAELSPLVPFVKFELEESEADAQLTLDDELISRDRMELLLPIDPGDHDVRLSAPGRAPRTVHFEVAKGSRLTTVKVAALVAVAPKDAPPTMKPSPSRLPAQADDRTLLSRRNVTIGLVSIGALGLLTGTYFGVRTLGEQADSDVHCNGIRCDAAGVQLRADARSHALVSTLGFGVGLASLGGLAAVVLTRTRKEDATLRVVPSVRVAGSGLALEGAW